MYDTLEQHRRLTRQINLIKLLNSLDLTFDGIALTDILVKLEELGFTTPAASWLVEYGNLAVRHSEFLHEFARQLEFAYKADQLNSSQYDYETYLGGWYAHGCHIEIATALNYDSAANAIARFKKWQLDPRLLLPLLKPNFGLSRDHDLFIIGIAPTLWALLAVLFKRNKEASDYFLSECISICDAIGIDGFDAFAISGIWSLHIAAEIRNEPVFNKLRDSINAVGGLPSSAILSPIGGIGDFNVDERWENFLNEPRQVVPAMDEFRSRLTRSRLKSTEFAVRSTVLTLSGLVNDDGCLEWGDGIAKLLHADVDDED